MTLLNELLSLSSGLSLAVQRFSQSLHEFQFECIGDAETDDEISIGEMTVSLMIYKTKRV